MYYLDLHEMSLKQMQNDKSNSETLYRALYNAKIDQKEQKASLESKFQLGSLSLPAPCSEPVTDGIQSYENEIRCSSLFVRLWNCYVKISIWSFLFSYILKTPGLETNLQHNWWQPKNKICSVCNLIPDCL